MADEKITELPAATLPLSGTEKVPIVQDGETRKVSSNQIIGQLRGYAPGTYLAPIPNANASRTVIDGQMQFTPFILPAPAVINEINQRSSNVPGSTESWAMAIYGVGQGNLPTGAPLYGGAAVTPTYNFVHVGYTGVGLSLMPGLYWFAFVGVGGGSYQNGNSAIAIEVFRTVAGYDDQIAVQQAGTNSVPVIASQTPGVWPTLTGSYSDFTGLSANFIAATVGLRTL